MKKEVKQKWVEALRSGEYKQSKGKLHPTEDTYCCLGVLTDLCAKDKGLTWEQVITEDSNTLPRTVMEWAGLKSRNPILNSNGASLVSMNDVKFYEDDGSLRERMSFLEIADEIEKSDL